MPLCLSRPCGFFLFAAFLLFAVPLHSKAPKWKPGTMQVSAEGMRYSIKKTGTGDAIVNGDFVHCLFYFYNSQTHKFDRAADPFPPVKQNKGPKLVVTDGMNFGLSSALKMLKEGGEGFFIFPNVKNAPPGTDSTCYFVRVINVIHPLRFTIPEIADTVAVDTVKIVVTDPAQKFYGDSVFAVMKLVEVPQMTNCGTAKMLIAFKFEMSWFENGTQRKNIVVFVECPEQYGAGYFVKGGSYVVTAVPMVEEYKTGHRTMNGYSFEKLEMYYGLRVKKM